MNCPNCGREMADAGPVCEHCGHELIVAGSPTEARKPRRFNRWVTVLLVVLALGFVAELVVYRFLLKSDARLDLPFWSESEVSSGFTIEATATASVTAELAKEGTDSSSLLEDIQPPGGYAIAASFGNIGPQLLEVGAIDFDRFVQLYEQAGQPLSDRQVAILQEGGDFPVQITRDNAYFLLNFFWAFGLANRNSLLEGGPMMQFGEEGVGRFASTAGWTLGTIPATEFYSSAPIISLTAEQQARVEEVAQAVYRPCCGNPTSFPDCNHGMAMLGLLELMASQGATEDEMFEAAKYVNAYWFPQQMLEVATYFEAAEGVSFADLDGRLASGPDVFSGQGFREVHQWLADKGLLEQLPGQGGSCGV